MSSTKNQVMNHINEELQKGLPSKRKVLSYLLNLLNRDKYPSLSDSESFNIIGETYKLTLNCNLSLELFFEPIYKKLKKLVKKNYGIKIEMEMEQHLSENFGLYGRDHALIRIKKEFDRFDSSHEANRNLILKTRLLSFFNTIRPKDKYKLSDDYKLSYSDFYFIVGKVYELNRTFFVNYLYHRLRKSIKKAISLEMNKYLLENFGFVPRKGTLKGGLSLKVKFFFIASIICSLIFGLIVTGMILYTSSIDGQILSRWWGIPIAFLVGFFIPIIVLIIDKIHDFLTRIT
ncbi:MAG: hypothetical protein ACFFA4_10940 [Promethearchaeota archaeon]